MDSLYRWGRRIACPTSDHIHAAVDLDSLAVDVAGGVRAEERMVSAISSLVPSVPAGVLASMESRSWRVENWRGNRYPPCPEKRR